jgi:hypothetical protein
MQEVVHIFMEMKPIPYVLPQESCSLNYVQGTIVNYAVLFITLFYELEN